MNLLTKLSALPSFAMYTFEPKWYIFYKEKILISLTNVTHSTKTELFFLLFAQRSR